MTLKSNLETYRRLDKERMAGVWKYDEESKVIKIDDNQQWAATNCHFCGGREKDYRLMAASPSILSDLERAVGLIEEMKQVCEWYGEDDSDAADALTHYKNVMGD